MVTKLLSLSIVVSIAMLAIVLHGESAPAGKTINVNSTADTIANDGACTLREAVIAANNDTASGGQTGECPAGDGVDTILLPAGLYKFPNTVILEDAALSGDLDILESLTIQGGGVETTTIDGNKQDRIFDIPDNGTIVHISNLTITNGFADGNGGGILNNGDLHLNSVSFKSNGDPVFIEGGGIANFGTSEIKNSEFHSNFAAGGGAIRNHDTMVIDHCVISGNGARFDAGGIENADSGNIDISFTVIDSNSGRFESGISNSGAMTISNSTVSNNYADIYCAGIMNQGNLEIANSTISGNTSGENGGGLCNQGGTTQLIFSTITKNSTCSGGSDCLGAGLFIYGGTATIGNSIIAGNISDLHPDCSSQPGGIISSGYNLIGNANGCNWVTKPGDQIGWPNAPINPKLCPLTDNGGPTPTHALLSGSPAIDSAHPQIFLEKDQRGVVRPQGQRADPGSYEAVQLSIEDIQVSEKTAGISDALIKVSLSGKNVREIQVHYKTVDGTAKAVSDYVEVTGTLTFPVGTLSKSIKVTILPDLIKEATEVFYIGLSSETYSVILDKTGKVTIQDTSKWTQYLPIMIK